MIKLIVSDIDGTLAEDGGSELKPEVYETILKLKKQGIYFVAASGRHVTGMEHIFQPVRDNIFYIATNGAYLGCRGRSLFQAHYRQELAAEMISDMKARGLDVMIDCAERVYTDSQNEEFVDWLLNGYHFDMVRMDDLRELKEPIVKIAACRMSGITEHFPPLSAKYGKELKVTLSGNQWIDTMDPAVNKGNALRLLQESLDILPEETVAFGDQLNDIEMLKQAYYSFAVANARPETKAAARFLADSNVNDGVLKVMKLFVERTNG